MCRWQHKFVSMLLFQLSVLIGWFPIASKIKPALALAWLGRGGCYRISMQESSSGSSLTGSGRRQGSWPCLMLVCIEANFSYNEHLFEGAFEVLKHLDGQSPTCPPPSLSFPASSLTALSLCPVHPRSLAVPCCFPPLCTESLFGLQDFFLYKIPVHPSRPSWSTICSFKPL